MCTNRGERDTVPLSTSIRSQQTAPVGHRAGEAEEIQRPPVEASGVDPGSAGRTPRRSCRVGQKQTERGVCVCV